jgi:hypothetical protein
MKSARAMLRETILDASHTSTRTRRFRCSRSSKTTCDSIPSVFPSPSPSTGAPRGLATPRGRRRSSCAASQSRRPPTSPPVHDERAPQAEDRCPRLRHCCAMTPELTPRLTPMPNPSPEITIAELREAIRRLLEAVEQRLDRRYGWDSAATPASSPLKCLPQMVPSRRS